MKAVMTDEELEAQSRFFGEIDRPTCAVVVGSTDQARNWTADGYARAIEELQNVHGLQPILVGGPSAGEREMADRISSLTNARPIDTLGDDLRTSIHQYREATDPDTRHLRMEHIKQHYDRVVQWHMEAILSKLDRE